MTYIAEPKPPGAGFDYPDLHHLDGVPWFEAPIPRRLHRCSPQTIGRTGFDEIHRCPCGALRNTRFRGWLERNSRKRKDDEPVPGTPYIERKQAQIDQREALWAELRSRGASS